MSNRAANGNPAALYALLVSLISVIPALSLLGLLYNVGPQTLLYYVAQSAGIFSLLAVVSGSGLALFAITRMQNGWDHRITLTILFLLISVYGLFSFGANG